jgi:hypothetical protein
VIKPGGRDIGAIALFYRARWEIIEGPHSLVGKNGRTRQACQSGKTRQYQQRSAHESPVF